MTNNIYKLIERIANLKTALALTFLSLFMIFAINVLDLPFGVKRIESIAPKVGILDFYFFYTSDTAYKLLDNLTLEGRQTYFNLLIYFDFIFPVIYSLSLSISIFLIFRTAYSEKNNLTKLCLLGLLAGLFDCLENISTLIMIINYPQKMLISNFAGYFTFGKHFFILISLGLIFFGLSTQVRKKLIIMQYNKRNN